MASPNANPSIDPSLESALDPALTAGGSGAVPPTTEDGEGPGALLTGQDGGIATAEEIDAVLAAATAASLAASATQAGEDGDIPTTNQTDGAGAAEGDAGKAGKYKAGDAPAKLAKAKVQQCATLREAAEKALEGIWALLDDGEASSQSFKISRSLDRTLGQLHALSGQYKPDYKALIWVADIPLKSIRENYRSGPGPAYFAIKKTNIAFIAEYLLYAMPGEEGFGKNDLVYACEGLLPLVPPTDLLEQEETWKLFNELKIQIYIQRLHTAGRTDADQRVLPNLFVESLSSYSGQQFSDELQKGFDDLGQQIQAEIVVANGDLDVLTRSHPYEEFVASALRFLRTCSDRIDAEMQTYDLEHPEEEDRPKKSRKPNHYRRSRGIGGLADAPGFGLMAQLSQQAAEVPGYGDEGGDIQVERAEDDPDFDGEGGTPKKPRFNPYKLGRGKGAMAAPRRRWTNEELDLLLEEVRLHAGKYDCMAQIIKRHGRNGEISQVLKDQNNVSLKDKARNLTMEWGRNGYPEGKEWVADAFARFAVKGGGGKSK